MENVLEKIELFYDPADAYGPTRIGARIVTGSLGDEVYWGWGRTVQAAVDDLLVHRQRE